MTVVVLSVFFRSGSRRVHILNLSEFFVGGVVGVVSKSVFDSYGAFKDDSSQIKGSELRDVFDEMVSNLILKSCFRYLKSFVHPDSIGTFDQLVVGEFRRSSYNALTSLSSEWEFFRVPVFALGTRIRQLFELPGQLL